MPRINDIDRDLEDEEVYERIRGSRRLRQLSRKGEREDEEEYEDEQEELLNQRH